MDKFDQTIKDAAPEPMTPREQFVDTTMHEIDQQGQKHHHGRKFWLPSLAGVIVVIVLIIFLLPFGSSNPSKKATTAANTTNSSTAGSATTSNGNSNADLESDLNGIQGSMNQENSDQGSATKGLNDSQYEIAVPTD